MCHNGNCGRGYPERGWIQFLILRLLYERPAHGYQLLEDIERKSCGCHKLEPGSIYTILRRMEEKGLLESQWKEAESGPYKRVYKVTEKGALTLRGGLQMMTRRKALMDDLTAFYKTHFEKKGDEK